MPLPLPIEDDVSSVVVDALPLPDLAKEAAGGRVIDLQTVNGSVPSLVLVIEASAVCLANALPSTFFFSMSALCPMVAR